MSSGKIVIVRKKKKGAHAHHGGSWKVAYADFVTAMMAFFLVMWIMNLDQGVKDLVEGYFQNPVGFKQAFSGGRNILSRGNTVADIQMQQALIIRRRMDEEERLREASRAITERLQSDGALSELGAAIEVVVTDEGLRIELMETGRGQTFFERGSAELTPALEAVLRLIASELGDLPNDVVVEGHTDKLPMSRRGYSNWELSSDRANAARRLLVQDGLATSRLMEVRAYADRHLKYPDDPYDPRNRRVSLLLPFVTPAVADVERELAEMSDRIRSQGTVGAAP